MTFEVGVVGSFHASHHLVGEFGPAREPHAHDYRVEVWVTGAELHADGTLFDISRLQSALERTLAALDGHDLNQVPELAHPNPTAETVARYFFHRLSSALTGQGLQTLRTRVWESAEAFAGYADALT